VSTRKLILAALLCGLAILVAGGALFVKLGNQPSITVNSQQGQVTVGPYVVSVLSSSVVGTARVVRVQVAADASAPAIPDVEGAFSLTIGEIRPRQDPPDAATSCRQRPLAAGATVQCDLAFVERASGTPYLAFRGLGTTEVRWKLDR
jgi:hypothetical protein